jgi:hypothetical protein
MGRESASRTSCVPVEADLVQSEAPASANFPASQSEQVLADVAPKDCEYLPDGQLEQVAEPTDALYVPAVQLVHGPPSGPL